MNLGEAVVLSDLLPESMAAHIRDVLLSEDFPWGWNERTLDENELTDYTKTTHQFVHVLWFEGRENSVYGYIPVEIVKAFTSKIGIDTWYLGRAKVNLLCTLGDIDVNQQHEIHRDVLTDERAHSIVYYVGESDGDTVIYNNGEEAHRSQHRDNSAVMFNSLTQHRGSLPRKHKRRVVVNIVFQIKEENT